MLVRMLLRHDDLQLKLEKFGAVVTPFLTEENTRWLLQISQNQLNQSSKLDDMSLHELLFEKLQSKVEYRCINCSPFFTQITSSAYYNDTPKPYYIKDSITDETKFPSLHLLAPLIKASDPPLEFRFLAGSHSLKANVRGVGISDSFVSEAEWVSQNFSTLKIKSGEAILFFRNVPHSLGTAWLKSNVPMLEISVLPYEARKVIYTLSEKSGEKMLQPYETTLPVYMRYLTDGANATQEMKSFRPTQFIPKQLTREEKKKLELKSSWRNLFLKTVGLA